ncbi:MAG: helicase [Elusimicrobia bacterium RIFOXYA2_FULL_53_38]|nr:MAG: helicase [Elusimicrobia bacterium RIFOXYA2_FULL_53_38]
MILRDRQKTFVDRSVTALQDRGNTLGVAPTGSGKTIMLAAVVGRVLAPHGAKACILAHRDEITSQNVSKFLKLNPGMPVSIVNAGEKAWSGKTVFAMVQTLARKRNLDQMPPLDLLVIDEAHHARAETYLRIIEAAKTRNPDLMIYGVTATPNRGDGKTLRNIFDNCADQITLSEMIASGQLVPPRTFVIDIGVQEDLKKVKRVADEYDMSEVASILDRRPINDEILRHWQEKAGKRSTVVFCSTVAHASHITDAFLAAGVKAELVSADTPDEERAAIFKRLDTRETQVLVNVAVATEGWDCPPVSCVVLLRPCSHKSTMIQMIGRGLRKIEPDLYPGLIKTDCVVLDFGTSALLHGSLEQTVKLEAGDREGQGEAPVKKCPKCHAEVPIAARECPFCGHEFASIKVTRDLEDFEMTEIDLINRSPFKWSHLTKDGSIIMATGFNAWGGIFLDKDRWLAVGGAKGVPAHVLYVGNKTTCLASADDWLCVNETEDAAHKSRRWLHQAPTDKQLIYLPDNYKNLALTRYDASCILAHTFNKARIQSALAQARRPE